MSRLRTPSRPRFRALLVSTLVALAAACGGGGGGSAASTPAGPALSSISLSPATPILNLGMTADLQATLKFADGTTSTAADDQLTWTSLTPSVASVSGTGVVTALAAGSTSIRAAKDGVQATVSVVVTSSTVTLTGLAVSPTSGTVGVGNILSLAADALWSNGTGSSGYASRVAWVSSNPAVATVDAMGIVTGQAAGSATITASLNGHSASAVITVSGSSPTLTSISLSPAGGAMSVGGTLDLTATANWSSGPATTPYDSALTWTTSNPSVAVVNGSGVVTALAAGSATITATRGSVHASVTVTASGAAFDPALVGSWQYISVGGEYGSFYTFNANGTFTYSLIYHNQSSCISFSQVVAFHAGTFSSSSGKIILNCTTLYDDYSNCGGVTTRYSKPAAVQEHQASFNSGLLYTNNSNDFVATGWLGHAKQ
ncbi:MAG TPA: Ig-like domain-containing protein [Holophagaceae bacterium]|nr:Ig-like domain-containing protein [Holophagaceae bacterium]